MTVKFWISPVSSHAKCTHQDCWQRRLFQTDETSNEEEDHHKNSQYHHHAQPSWDPQVYRKHRRSRHIFISQKQRREVEQASVTTGSHKLETKGCVTKISTSVTSHISSELKSIWWIIMVITTLMPKIMWQRAERCLLLLPIKLIYCKMLYKVKMLIKTEVKWFTC